jgi:hypothetical protein
MYCLGTTLAPDDATMREWIKYPVDALLHGQDPSGGWSPGRSSVVAWGPDSQQYYYKSGDDDQFDLVFWPLLLPSDFDLAAFIATMMHLQDVWLCGVYQYFLALSADTQELVSAALLEFLHHERATVAAIMSSTLDQLRRFKAWFDSEVAQQLSPAYLCIPTSLIIMPVHSELPITAESFEASSRPVIVADADEDL